MGVWWEIAMLSWPQNKSADIPSVKFLAFLSGVTIVFFPLQKTSHCF